jgi:hypothetical protein
LDISSAVPSIRDVLLPHCRLRAAESDRLNGSDDCSSAGFNGERLGRTLPVVTMSEADGVALVNENVDRMATLSADEASHWGMLHACWSVDRVNHSEAYSDHGKHTNWAESYFSRLRRMVVGQHHHVSPRYLHQYFTQAAWLEDNRRKDNGSLAFGLVQNAMAAPVSCAWKGYWQNTVC